MPKSPLDSSFVGKRNNSLSKPILIVALLATLGLGGGVLAANITVNSGGAIEFGQGTVTTISCDTSVTLSPTSTFNNTTFIVSSIEIRDIDQTATTGTTANTGCYNKTLTVKALNSSGTVLGSVATVVPTSVSESATITVSPSPAVTASDVSRLTLESN